jgi:hypothetical protein
MAFSVIKSRPLRGLGLYRGSGKHAAPRGVMPEPRRTSEQEPAKPYKAMHAASAPRLSAEGDSAEGDGAPGDGAAGDRKAA